MLKFWLVEHPLAEHTNNKIWSFLIYNCTGHTKQLKWQHKTLHRRKGVNTNWLSNVLGSRQENSTADEQRKTNPHAGRGHLGRDTRELVQTREISPHCENEQRDLPLWRQYNQCPRDGALRRHTDENEAQVRDTGWLLGRQRPLGKKKHNTNQNSAGPTSS